MAETNSTAYQATTDRPFGIDLWTILNQSFLIFLGYPAADFQFNPPVTPFSSVKSVAISIGLYYAVILSGRELMRNRKPFELKKAFLAHNLFLTIISAALLVLFMEQMLPKIQQKGLVHTICDADGGWTPKLGVIYYITYITKYIELFDTVFLVLKKKPLTFLHTYHHGATAVLVFIGMSSATPVSWIVATLNLAVHVIMYWYYFQSARGVRVWWKKWITVMQIAQFVIDLGFLCFVAYNHLSIRYLPGLPNVGSCDPGDPFMIYLSLGILGSYLLLFVSFYLATYKSKGKGKSRLEHPQRLDQQVVSESANHPLLTKRLAFSTTNE